MERLVSLARRRVRESSRAGLHEELVASGIPAPSPAASTASVTVDSEAAARAGARAARAAHDVITGKAEHEALDAQARRMAAWEVHAAQNLEREEQARIVQSSTRILLVKRWNAAGDRRTCPVCEEADGTTVPVNEDFPQGTPGAVHPSCRCDFDVIPESEL